MRSTRFLNESAFSAALLGAFVLGVVVWYALEGLPQTSAIPAVLWVAMLASAFTLFFAIFRPEIGPIGLCAAFYTLLSYLLPGMLHVGTGVFPFFNPGYSSETILDASWSILTFLLTFSAFYWLAVSRPSAMGPATESFCPEERQGPRLVVVSIAYAVLALVLATLVGWPNMLASRAESSEAGGIGSGMLTIQAIARALSFLALLIWLAFIRRGGFLRRGLIYACGLLLVFLLVFVLCNFPLAVPRYLLAAYAVATLFVFFQPSITTKGLAAVLIFAALFTLFPLLSELARGTGDTGTLAASWWDYYSSHGDFDGLQSTLTAIEWVSSEGLRGGHQILSALLFFVPREWWPTKSVGTGADAASYFGFPFVNLSAPLPVELYVDFGTVGVLVGSALGGYLLGSFDRPARPNASVLDQCLQRLPAAVLAGYMFILLRGSLVAVLGPPVITTVLALLSRRLLIGPTTQPR